MTYMSSERDAGLHNANTSTTDIRSKIHDIEREWQYSPYGLGKLFSDIIHFQQDIGEFASPDRWASSSPLLQVAIAMSIFHIQIENAHSFWSLSNQSAEPRSFLYPLNFSANFLGNCLGCFRFHDTFGVFDSIGSSRPI